MRKAMRTRALHALSLTATAMVLSAQRTLGFVSNPRSNNISVISNPSRRLNPLSPTTSTSLNVWWFGGSDTEEDEESCELVAVRIERTSANSRRIAGDIIVPKPVDDVWAILTDYDNLAIHVPNLVESKRVNPGRVASMNNQGVQGDGNYQCRLFQRGAQKIVGFEFGASVTMDMTETIMNNRSASSEEKKITFKCVDSQFFSEFDGEWKVSETTDPEDPTKVAAKVEYVVDVRPRGPVPVQALEWRIREDVPTNLRAVKAASIDLGEQGVLALRESQRKDRNGGIVYKSVPGSRTAGRLANAANSTRRNAGDLMNRAATASKNAVANATAPRPQKRLSPVRVQWYDDETMGAYLNDGRSSRR